jgi:hypothetical protein
LLSLNGRISSKGKITGWRPRALICCASAVACAAGLVMTIGGKDGLGCMAAICLPTWKKVAGP